MALIDILWRNDTDDATTYSRSPLVGDVVIPVDTSGIEPKQIAFPPKAVVGLSDAKNVRWGHAICVSVSPFVLVSEKADMRWTEWPIGNVLVVGVASADAMNVANQRVNG